MRGSLYLLAGYVKANGATVQRADYPRLVALADKHNLWTDDTAANAGLFGRGDGAATMVLPNWTDRMMQFAGDNAGASVTAGLPNITGGIASAFADINRVPLGAFSVKTRRNGSNIGSTAINFWAEYDFDASKSNPTYGASETVQPAAIKLIPIIRY